VKKINNKPSKSYLFPTPWFVSTRTNHHYPSRGWIITSNR